jgi:hypothetical protein
MSTPPSELDGETDSDNSRQRKRATTQRGPFLGDTAAVELRNRLARENDQVPVTPSADSPVSMSTARSLIGAIAVIAAGAAIGYLWASATPPSLIPEFPPSEASSRNQADARPATLAPEPTPQLLVSAERAQQADQPARLAISARGVGAANVSVVIAGLAPGSTMSAGAPAGPNLWQLPTANLRDAALMPPRGFVGVMNLTLELRFVDGTILDRTGLQLDWAGNDNLASSELPQRQLDAAEIALLLRNGTVLMESGDIIPARLMFQRAAEAGDAPAAFALAETYDPAVLEKLGTKGAIKADIALAEKWYAKAKDLGSTAAPERLARITRRP